MDGYDRDRDDFNNNARGRIWENGTDRFYRDRENGYTKPPQSREHWTPEGFRRYDKEKLNEKGQILAVEDKSGSMTGENDRRELEKDRFLLERGIIEHLLVRSVQGESVSKECRELLTGLKRDFPDKFTHLEISRSDAREVWAKGLAIERGKGQQLELSGVREKAREGKAQALEKRREKIAEIAKARERKERAQQRLENIRAIIRAKERAERFRQIEKFRASVARGRAEAPARVQHERAQAAEAAKAREQEARERPARELAEKKAALAKALEDQARQINEAHAKGKTVEVEQVRQAHADLSKALREIREAEREQAFEMLTASGYTPHQAYTMQPVLEQERERQRRDVVLGINTIGVIVAREDKAAEARETKAAPAKEAGRERTEAEREQTVQDKAERERVAELQRVNRASQGRPPQAAVLEPPQQTPQVQGHGRDGKGISRGPERTR
ncbi:hypothetical protein ACQPW1_10125 [Nocardia sp. CA-128927]|uniref:hypothetical protein n=1 Tax=Nocardia sp. CA-128927 TaxID=3239975 RepID=UPI003D95294E